MADSRIRKSAGAQRHDKPRKAPVHPSIPTARQQKYLELELRIRLNALKFCPTYRSWWRAACTMCGGEKRTIEALGEVRAGATVEGDPVRETLDHLARIPLLMGRGPVVPGDPEDYPDRPWPGAPQPALSTYLGVRMLEPDLIRDRSTAWPALRPVLVVLDFSRPDSELGQGISALRRELDSSVLAALGPKDAKASGFMRKVNRARRYVWGGPEGWEVTFGLIASAESRKVGLRELGEQLAREKFVAESTPKDPASRRSAAEREAVAARKSKNASKMILEATIIINELESKLQEWGPLWAPRFWKPRTSPGEPPGDGAWPDAGEEELTPRSSTDRPDRRNRSGLRRLRKGL